MNKLYVLLLFVVIFCALALSGVFSDKKLSPSTTRTSACVVGEEVTAEKIVSLPRIKDRDVDIGTFSSGGWEDQSITVPYRLVRKNVLMYMGEDKGPNGSGATIKYFASGNHTVLYPDANQPGYAVYYPARYGEISLDREFNASYRNFRSGGDGTRNQFRFRQEGMIYFVQLDPVTGNPVEVIAKDEDGIDAPFWFVDFYQDVEIFNKTKDYTLSDVFKCQGSQQAILSGDQALVFPSQKPEGDRKQLQLRYVLPLGGIGAFAAHCKPAIYLYPKEPMDVSVKVNTKGILTYTDPVYPKDTGWSVVARPDGTIIENGKEYPYLYYESKVPDALIQKPEKGFVVTYQDLPKLYSWLLPSLGLDQKQTGEFTSYWNKALHFWPYYFVGILDQRNIDSFEPLSISPAPDTNIRVRLYFEGLQTMHSVMPPALPSPKRHGFTMVEWGGMVKTDKEHPFTCSQ